MNGEGVEGNYLGLFCVMWVFFFFFGNSDSELILENWDDRILIKKKSIRWEW